MTARQSGGGSEKPLFGARGGEEDEEETGKDPRTWGPYYWFVWHQDAAAFPQRPTQEQREETKTWVKLYLRRLPCPNCRRDAQVLLAANPLLESDLENAESYSRYVWAFHDAVNAKLEKRRRPDFEQARKWFDVPKPLASLAARFTTAQPIHPIAAVAAPKQVAAPPPATPPSPLPSPAQISSTTMVPAVKVTNPALARAMTLLATVKKIPPVAQPETRARAPAVVPTHRAMVFRNPPSAVSTAVARAAMTAVVATRALPPTGQKPLGAISSMALSRAIASTSNPPSHPSSRIHPSSTHPPSSSSSRNSAPTAMTVPFSFARPSNTNTANPRSTAAATPPPLTNAPSRSSTAPSSSTPTRPSAPPRAVERPVAPTRARGRSSVSPSLLPTTTPSLFSARRGVKV